MDVTIKSKFKKDDQVIFKVSREYNAVTYGIICNTDFCYKTREFSYDIMIYGSEFERVYNGNNKNPSLLKVDQFGPAYMVKVVPEDYIFTKIE